MFYSEPSGSVRFLLLFQLWFCALVVWLALLVLWSSGWWCAPFLCAPVHCSASKQVFFARVLPPLCAPIFLLSHHGTYWPVRVAGCRSRWLSLRWNNLFHSIKLCWSLCLPSWGSLSPETSIFLVSPWNLLASASGRLPIKVTLAAVKQFISQHQAPIPIPRLLCRVCSFVCLFAEQ